MPLPVIFLAFANDKVNNARYLRNIPAEHNGIRKALQEAEKQGLCEIVERSNASIEQIIDVFQDSRYRDRIAIFHFGGHADGYQLLLESSLHLSGFLHLSGLKDLTGVNQTAHGEGLVAFLSKQKGLQLVFFNGCTTEQQAKELSQAGIPVVIGTVSEVNDEVATDLAVRFYKGIGQEMDLERAWQEAKDEISMKNGTTHLRGLYRKGLREALPNKMPWEMYAKEEAKNWKLEKITDTFQVSEKEEMQKNKPDITQIAEKIYNIDNANNSTFN
ncbi:CHAT domain-containing protein [Thermoflexibacter ruber]|uniref:CHAT domain-containing protein n=1 Tax=Thermoflexibacter ruber TaxID=1003 RepID=A0A1I2FEH7_9BACT|nr:CHAT domain-containing protein [Thermoflexibacter ruber]SFF03299.1 CHAT domain-containing protein [Thermoflexibacter ruber]